MFFNALIISRGKYRLDETSQCHEKVKHKSSLTFMLHAARIMASHCSRVNKNNRRNNEKNVVPEDTGFLDKKSQNYLGARFYRLFLSTVSLHAVVLGYTYARNYFVLFCARVCFVIYEPTIFKLTISFKPGS